MTLTPRLDRLEKNLLINSEFRFIQRGNNLTIPGAGSYSTVDRWRVGFTAPISVPASLRSATIPSGEEPDFSLTLQGTVGATGGSLLAEQRIESLFMRQAVLQGMISFACKVATESASQVQIKMAYANSADNFTSVTEFFSQTSAIVPDGANASVFAEIKHEAISIPSAAKNGIVVTITFLNFTVNGAGQDHRIYAPMLNAGSKALLWATAGRDVAEELQLCQRYFEKSYPLETAVGSASQTTTAQRQRVVTSGNDGESPVIHFRVTKRTIPLKTVYNDSTGAANQVRNASTVETYTEDGSSISVGYMSTHYAGGVLATGNLIAFHWAADAEF